MKIYVTGINYRTAPVQIRENLSFNLAEEQQALLHMAGFPQVDECVLLSTCNRTEIYIYTETPNFDQTLIENELCRVKSLPAAEYRRYFYFYQGMNAVKHLFRVAAGLDSMVMGEDQVLGQVKKAHRTALQVGTSRTYLNTLFREAVTSAKSVKRSGNLPKIPGSVASLAVKMVQQRLSGGWRGKTVLLIGSGEISGLVCASLAHMRVKKIMIASRRRREMTSRPGGLPPVEYVDYNERYDFMDEADVIVSATASPHYTITRDRLKESIISRKERMLVDLAVPRDIDADSQELPGVVYINIDNLAENVEAGWELRISENIKAEKIMNEGMLAFEKWYEFRNMLPLIKEIQDTFDGYATEKINQTIAKLKSASPEDKEVVQKSMRNLTNYLLNKHIYAVKEIASGEEAGVYLKCLGKTLGVEESNEDLCGGDRSRRKR